jgi:hypothetical protein
MDERFYAEGLVVEAHCVQCGHRPLGDLPIAKVSRAQEPHHRKDVGDIWWPDRGKGQRW